MYSLQYSPYKKGSKLTKARRAKALGLEAAASALINAPQTLDLSTWVQPATQGREQTAALAKPGIKLNII